MSRNRLATSVAVALLLAGTAALWPAIDARAAPLIGTGLPLPAVLLGTALLPLYAVRVQFRRVSQEFSFDDAALVLALYLADPIAAVGGFALGRALGRCAYMRLWLRRTPELGTVVRELSTGLLVGTLAVALFQAWVPREAALGGWAPAVVLGVAVVADLIQGAVLDVYASVVRGPISAGEWRVNLATGLAVALSGAALALLALLLWRAAPAALPLLLVVVAMSAAAQRAGATGRLHADRLSFLYDASRRLQGAGSSAEAVDGIVPLARGIFRARTVEVLADPPPPDGTDMSAPTGEGRHVRVADRLDAGKPFAGDERELLGALATVLGAALDNHRLVDDLTTSNARLQHEATHDRLTGLANRALVRQALTAALAAGSGIAVALIDLDDFKQVNDHQGHAAGDRLLETVADRLRAAAGPGDLPARLGGDEFAVLLAGVHDLVAAQARAEVLLAALNRPAVLPGGLVLPVRASVGVGLAADADDVEGLLRNADMALYAAKADGKGVTRGYEGHLRATAERERALERDLAAAVARDELSLAYQPIFAVPGRRIVAVEALLRWRHDGQPVPPAEFLPVAERTGAIEALGRWTMARACAQLRAWLEVHGERAPQAVGVNISPWQLTHGDVLADVRAALAASGLPPSCLILEVNQGVAAGAPPTRALETLADLRAMGVRVAIDDFGSGPSSLGYLRAMPVDGLKVDRTVTAGLARDDHTGDFARGVLGLAAGLRGRVVAGGIETAEQLAALPPGVYAQGFLLSRPLSAEAFEAGFLAPRVVEGAEAGREGAGGLGVEADPQALRG